MHPCNADDSPVCINRQWMAHLKGKGGTKSIHKSNEEKLIEIKQ